MSLSSSSPIEETEKLAKELYEHIRHQEKADMEPIQLEVLEEEGSQAQDG
jgi:hypothetical protein